MIYNFVKAHHIQFPNLDYGYVLEISTLEQLFDYYVIKAMPDIRKSIEGLARAWEKNVHTSDEMASAIEKLAKGTGIAPVDIAGDLVDTMMRTQIEMLQKGPVYLQKNGSYMPGSGIKITERLEFDHFVWPSKRILTEKDIKTTRWQGGVHYYVSVDGVQLGKRNTPEYARELAMSYIEEHNKKV